MKVTEDKTAQLPANILGTLGTCQEYDHKKKVWKVKLDVNQRVAAIPYESLSGGGMKDLRKA